MYKVLAWLPGTDHLIVEDQQANEIGWVNHEGYHSEPWRSFLDAACAKYGYKRLQKTVELTALANVQALGRELQEKPPF